MSQPSNASHEEKPKAYYPKISFGRQSDEGYSALVLLSLVVVGDKLQQCV
jgi:hypothetical protein